MGASCHNLWIMSDDFGTFVPSWIGDRTIDYRESYQSWYGWAKESQMTPKGDEKIDPAWEHFYHKVLMCNIIERDVDEFENDPEGVKSVSYTHLVKTDYAKLRYLIVLDKKLNGNFSRIKQIAEAGEIMSEILPGFPAEELVKPSNFVSLLFYFGILTIDREEEGMVVLKVPNLTIRQMLFSYLERGYSEAGVFEVKMMELGSMMGDMAYRGVWRPVFEYFGDCLLYTSS